MKRAALLVLAAAAALLPAAAQADYLYNAMPPERMPYVIVIMDNSYTMSRTDGGQYGVNPDGSARTRLDSAKRVFTNLLPEIEGVGIGFIHFYENNKAIDLNGNGSTTYLDFPVNGPANADASEQGRACGACLITYPDGVTDRAAILAEMAVMAPVTDTPLAISVSFAGRMIKRVLNSYTPGADVDGGAVPRQTSGPNEMPDDARDLTAADPQYKCRDYYVILMTDGQDSCTASATNCVGAQVAGQVPPCALAAGRTATANAITALLDLDVSAPGLSKKMVRTIVIGFVPGADAALMSDLNVYARKGHMAYDAAADSFPCQNLAAGAACGTGTALFATNESELQTAFRKAFEATLQGEFTGAEGIVSTVPQVKSEIDRVSRNFLVYGGFRQPGAKGRLYGIRLYWEYDEIANPGSGDFRYADLRPVSVGGPMDLDNCGTVGNPCAFEAGGLLTSRVAGGTSDRRIFTGQRTAEIAAAGGIGNTLKLSPTPSWITASAGGGGLTASWANYLANAGAGVTNLTMLNANVPTELAGGLAANGIPPLGTINGTHLQYMAEWLHGLPKSGARPFGRKWALGDIVHSSVAIVEPPGRPIMGSGYPAFRNYLRKRPTMVYVGANDGMIHAFHANDDVISLAAIPPVAATYAKGTEQWAYLPPSQLGNAAANILAGKDRFYSQDLSCRVDDVLVEPGVAGMVCDAANDCTCAGDSVNTHYCGWRTVLLCGQGWGGSWYSAIDVSDPYNPRPMWEFTDFQTGADAGLGRTWSLPGIGVVDIDGAGARWVAVFGNGYNSNHAPCTGTTGDNKKCNGAYVYNPANHALNFPFTGRFPQHGDGTQDDTGRVWALNVATGEPFGRYDVQAANVIADVPIIDVNNDALADVAFPATWGGEGGGGKNYVTRLFFPHTNAAGDTPLIGGAGNETKTRVNAWGICPADGVVKFGDSKPITIRPAVFAHPYRLNEVFLFAGSGVEKNPGVKHPDEQNNNGNQWDFTGVTFPDFGSSMCNASVDELCRDDGHELLELGNNGADRERLLGSPAVTRAPGGRDLLYFITYAPAEAFCENGEGFLHCVDITSPTTCLVCGDLNGDGTVDADDEYVSLNDPTSTDPESAPPPPSMTDGGVIVLGGSGPVNPDQAGVDSDGDGLIDPPAPAPGDPPCNSCGCPGHPPCEIMPRTVSLGWREIF